MAEMGGLAWERALAALQQAQSQAREVCDREIRKLSLRAATRLERVASRQSGTAPYGLPVEDPVFAHSEPGFADVSRGLDGPTTASASTREGIGGLLGDIERDLGVYRSSLDAMRACLAVEGRSIRGAHERIEDSASRMAAEADAINEWMRGIESGSPSQPTTWPDDPEPAAFVPEPTLLRAEPVLLVPEEPALIAWQPNASELFVTPVAEPDPPNLETDPPSLGVGYSLHFPRALLDCFGREMVGDAQRPVRVELLRVVEQGQELACLELVAFDDRGWWVHSEVTMFAAVPEIARSCVVTLADLQGSAESDESSHHVRLVWGDTLSVAGRVLDRLEANLVEGPRGDPEYLDDIDLDAFDGDGVIAVSCGRLQVDPNVLARLRVHGVRAGQIASIDGALFLSASGTRHDEVWTDLLTPLEVVVGEPATEAPLDRRTRGSEVLDLISAMSPLSTPDALLDVIESGVPHAQRRAAMHPSLPETVIEDLVRDGDESIRAAAAANANIADEAAEIAAQDPLPIVRSAIASNPHVGDDVLTKLVTDPEPQVRALVAANPATPAVLHEVLAGDADPWVRAAVAANENVVPQVLRALATDDVAIVGMALAQNVTCPPDILGELASAFPDQVLANPNAPRALLTAGAGSTSASIRVAVARNPATPAKGLKLLAKDDDYYRVLRAVLQHANTPGETRRRARNRITEIGGTAEVSATA